MKKGDTVRVVTPKPDILPNLRGRTGTVVSQHDGFVFVDFGFGIRPVIRAYLVINEKEPDDDR